MEIQAKPKQVMTATPQVFAARYSSCGEYLVAGGYDGQVRRWRASDDGDYEELPSVAGHNGWVEAFALNSHAGVCYSSDTWGRLRAWRLESGEPLWQADEAHDGWIRSVATSPDGLRLATCGMDRCVRIWNAIDGRLETEFTIADADLFCVQFHPDGDDLIAGDLLGRIHRWDVKSGARLQGLEASELYLYHRIQEVGGVRALAFSADGSRLAVGGTRPKNGATVQGTPTVIVFQWATGEREQVVDFGAANHCLVHDLTFCRDDMLAGVTSGTPGTGQLVLHRIGEEKPFFSNTKLPHCHSVSLHPFYSHLAVTTTNRGSNGNGRRLNKDGEYEGNNTPIHIFEYSQSAPATAKT